MEVNHEALLQNLKAEQRYAEQHFRSLQHSAALLRRDIQSKVQVEEVLFNLPYPWAKNSPSIPESAGRDHVESSTDRSTQTPCSNRPMKALCSYVGISRDMGSLQLPCRAQACSDFTHICPDRPAG